MSEVNVNDIVQFQAKETTKTDEVSKAFYKLPFADKLDTLYEMFCLIEDKKITDDKTFLHGHKAGIENGYTSAFFTMNYKEGIFGVDDEGTELPV